MRTSRIIQINETELGVEKSEPQVVETTELKDIPPKQLFNYNLKQLKSFDIVPHQCCACVVRPMCVCV